MEIEHSQADETNGSKSAGAGILGCLTAFFAYPILHAVIFRILAALHVFRVTDEFDQIYSNESGQLILIWSLHLVLITSFALLYYSRRRHEMWRKFAHAALGWQIISGGIFALLMTLLMNFSL